MPIFERIMVAAGNVALCSALSNVAHAQTTGDQTGSIALGARGGFSADSPTLRTQPQDRPENAFGYTMGAGMASDYIYRGVTLSDHQPAVGAVFEARYGNFYGGSTITSVKLPPPVPTIGNLSLAPTKSSRSRCGSRPGLATRRTFQTPARGANTPPPVSASTFQRRKSCKAYPPRLPQAPVISGLATNRRRWADSPCRPTRIGMPVLLSRAIAFIWTCVTTIRTFPGRAVSFSRAIQTPDPGDALIL